MANVETAHGLSSDLGSAISDAEDIIKHNSPSESEAGKIQNRLSAAMESAKATCQRLQEKTVAAAKATDRTVRDHPWEFVGVAFGVGLVIGLLASRR